MSTDFTSALSSINPELQTGLLAAGVGSTAYNMYNQYENQQYQNQLRSYAQDPAKMNAYAAQFTQPLNAGLTSAVANNTQGYLASRGLSDSPAISQQVEAQAIAPYVQQNQQAGYQDALLALQVGGGAVNPNNQSASSIAQLAKAFSALPGLKQLIRGSKAPRQLRRQWTPHGTRLTIATCSHRPMLQVCTRETLVLTRQSPRWITALTWAAKDGNVANGKEAPFGFLERTLGTRASGARAVGRAGHPR